MPVQLVRAADVGVAGFCPRHVVREVMTPRVAGFAADLEALLTVLAEGFKSPKPCAERRARRRKQRLVDQGAQQIRDHADNRCGAHGLRYPEAKLTAEHRESVKEPLFDRCQQVARPGNRGPQAPLPGHSAPSAGQKPESVVETVARSSARLIAGRRATANSIASGRPSSRRQMSLTMVISSADG